VRVVAVERGEVEHADGVEVAQAQRDRQKA
jgi:hypothetical protein